MRKKYTKPLHLNLKKGAYSKSVGVPEKENIPVTLTNKIISAKIPKGKKSVTIRNPTKSGKRQIKVTSLLKKRARLANNMRKWKR